MAFEQRQIQSQKLVLSPQIRQYLKILQLPLLDLRQAIAQELSENPMLEEIPQSADNEVSLSEMIDSDAGTSPENQDELDFQGKIEALAQIDRDFSDSFYPQSNADSISDAQSLHDFQQASLQEGQSLLDFLSWQLQLLDLTPIELTIATELIGNIDENGYLQSDLADVQSRLNATEDQMNLMLETIQELDPPGVGGRNLREVLIIQAERTADFPALALEILKDHFDFLRKKQIHVLATHLKKSEADIRKAITLIAKLEPKPGRIFYASNNVSIVPDASVAISDSDEEIFTITIHQESVPHLKINQTYRKMITDKSVDRETRQFVREKLESAMNLLKSLAQRKSTLRLITEYLVQNQREFFLKGFAYLKPLRLKDIADHIGVHESTVSRALSAKYISTPQGTIPYKSFFSSSIATEDGSSESQKSTMEKIRKMIDAEDKKKPLSDAKIMALLEADGFKIARRTVAKYRDLLKVLPTHLRREG